MIMTTIIIIGIAVLLFVIIGIIEINKINKKLQEFEEQG